MSDAATRWRRLRLKPNTSDDADWRGLQTTPNTLTAVVGGTTTAGVYSITFTGSVAHPKTSERLDVNFTASFTRVAENDATIADELENDMDAGIVSAAHPGVTLASLGITADVSSATITMTFPPSAIITATSSAPGSATIVWGLGTVVPITASNPNYARSGNDSINGSAIMVHAFDISDGTVPLAPGVGTQTTFSLQLIEICEVETVDSRGDVTIAYRYGGGLVLTGMTLDSPIELPTRTMKYWTVRMHTIANPVTDTSSYEIIHRVSVT